MTTRIVFAFFLTTILACNDNQPYQLDPLRITSLQSAEDKVARTFKYKAKRLYTFSSTGGVVTSSKFYYNESEQLSKIISDSTATSYKSTSILYNDSSLPTVDSTWTVVGKQRTLSSAHVFSFDGNQLQKIATHNFGTTVSTTETEFVWAGGNIAEVAEYAVIGTQRTLTQRTVLKYDKKKSFYPPDLAFFYTWPKGEWYQFSGANPTSIIVEGQKERTCTYEYNKFGYPAICTTEKKAKYIATYTGL